MSRSRTSVTLAVALTAGALAVVPFSPAAAQVATTVDIQVLGINDFHGRLVPPVAARAATDEAAAALTDGDPDNGEADVLVLLAHEGAATSAGPCRCRSSRPRRTAPPWTS